MESERFDRLARSMSSRRTVLGGSFAALLAAAGWDAAGAQPEPCRPNQKRCGKRCIPKRACCLRIQRRCGQRCIPKRSCCPGTEKPCNGRCIPAGAVCCPVTEKVCGTGCIPLAACCIDADCGPRRLCANGTCVVGQGTCEVGADICDSSAKVCGPASSSCDCLQTTAAETRCGSDALLSACGTCLSDEDCAEDFPEVPGAFCAVLGPGCGCVSVSTACMAPCPDD
jgi:hypothetical protein